MEFIGVSDVELDYLTRSNERRIDDKVKDSNQAADITNFEPYVIPEPERWQGIGIATW